MKPCQHHRQNGGRTAGTEGRVNRYSHPIRTQNTAQPSAQELLGRILERLERQGELLEELLRRTEGKDTI